MKNFLFSAAIAASMFFVSSCSNDSVITPEIEQGDQPTLLNVTTNIEVASRSVTGRPVNSFVSGDEIGLFVSSGAVNSPYNGVASNKNVKSAFTTVWTQATPVYLSSLMATIYAYYPWNAAATDGTAIDIDHTSQTDYMYATPVTNINNRQPRAAITMNHALSLVQFDFKKENYTGVGSLTAISIANKTGGTSLISTGKLNLTNGAITKGASKEPVTKATNLPQTIGTWNESTFPKMLVIPTSSTATAGDIVISFTVDGQVYKWNVPAGTAWEQGKKNTYTVTIKGTALEVSPVTITPWGNGDSGNGTIQ
ncbi:fimbrillin family protein [Bacteroides thetaiotaomicron]|jgi:hypothetical protein|uniref:fimbrillin family protein n=1 Tax=Bacteroides thetaiotaomicron TaxID=818 RepID=UPI00356393B0